MEEKIKKSIIADLCKEFQDVIYFEIEDKNKDLLYVNACVNFICELKEQGEKVDFNSFSQDIKVKVYEELRKQL